MENNHPVGLLFLSSEIRDHARASQKACDGLTIDQLKAGVVEKMVEFHMIKHGIITGECPTYRKEMKWVRDRMNQLNVEIIKLFKEPTNGK